MVVAVTESVGVIVVKVVVPLVLVDVNGAMVVVALVLLLVNGA